MIDARKKVMPWTQLFPLLDRTDSPLTRLEQGIFVTQVLAAVGLSEANNSSGVESPALRGAASADSESQRNIVHSVDNQALVLGAIF